MHLHRCQVRYIALEQPHHAMQGTSNGAEELGCGKHVCSYRFGPLWDEHGSAAACMFTKSALASNVCPQCIRHGANESAQMCLMHMLRKHTRLCSWNVPWAKLELHAQPGTRQVHKQKHNRMNRLTRCGPSTRLICHAANLPA